MVRVIAIVLACFALAALFVAATPVLACDQGVAVGSPAFSIVQAQPFVQPVYAQQFVQPLVAQPLYGQAVFRQRVVQPVVVRQRVVVRQPLVRVRAPFVAVGY